jgi:hypothetical protein
MHIDNMQNPAEPNQAPAALTQGVPRTRAAGMIRNAYSHTHTYTAESSDTSDDEEKTLFMRP